MPELGANSRLAMLGLIVLSFANPLRAQIALPLTDLGTRESSAEAIAAIPFDRLTPDARAKIQAVVERPTIYRRLPNKSIVCSPEMYLFLLRNPEVVVNMWQLMGITTVQCKRLGPYTHEGADGIGTLAKMDLVYGTKDLHVYYADGYHEGPLFRKHFNGKCVLILRTTYDGHSDQNTNIMTQLDFFLAFENAGAEIVAKTVQPLVGKTADSNFAESLNFVAQMSRAAVQKGDGVQLLAKRLNNVDAEVRDQFVDVTTTVYQRAQKQLDRQANNQAADPLANAAPVVRAEDASKSPSESASMRRKSSTLRLRR